MIEEYEKTKSENQILQVDVDYLANGEKCAYLAGYIDGMKYILERDKPKSNGAFIGSPGFINARG